MKLIGQIQGIIAAVVVAIALVVVGNMATVAYKTNTAKKLELEGKRIQDQAIYECGLVAQASWTDEGTGATVSVPYTKDYVECLKDKGYEVGR